MSMEESPRDGLRWADPPPKRPRYDWEAISVKLRNRPEDWLMIFEKDVSSIVVALRNDDIKALTSDQGFEVRTANNTQKAPRTCTLYMRYVPAADTRKDSEQEVE